MQTRYYHIRSCIVQVSCKTYVQPCWVGRSVLHPPQDRGGLGRDMHQAALCHGNLRTGFLSLLPRDAAADLDPLVSCLGHQTYGPWPSFLFWVWRANSTVGCWRMYAPLQKAGGSFVFLDPDLALGLNFGEHRGWVYLRGPLPARPRWGGGCHSQPPSELPHFSS